MGVDVGDIRDFGSKVIWFYVLTFLEPPKTCAEIKKTNYFRTSHDMCIMVLHLERVYDVRCTLCESREEKRN